MNEKSRGHIMFLAGFEYFTIQPGEMVRPNLIGHLYRAPVAYTYIQLNGYRSGARWLQPPHLVDQEISLRREKAGVS